ncbi:MAG TPA: O-antigen ligase family protein [Mucilaginibacter sp.]|nr:O-antigen ligase family protein [Mucilaginibacter sp.]
MNKLLPYRDSLYNQVSYFHLMLLMASLPFDMFYSHLILVSFGLHTFIHLNKKRIKPIFKVRTLALQSVFFITLLSTIYTINPGVAFNELGRESTIVIFPLLFCLNQVDLKKYRPQLLLAFVMVCTATIIYLYVDALLVIRHYKLPYLTLFSNAFVNHNFSEPIGMHATFFSIQVTLALVYLLTVLIKERQFYNRLFYLACCIILTAGLIQLCSKTVFIVLIIVINAGIPYFLLKATDRKRFILIAASVSVLIFAGIFSSKTFKARYITGMKDDLSSVQVNETTDTRLARWKAAGELIAKSPVIGYGAGSETGLLHESFFSKKMYSSFLNHLNAHNQYLSFLIKSGVIGLLCYLTTLAFGFNFAFRRGDILFFTFIMLIAFVSLSETIFDVDKGVFYYAFFFSFFIFSHEQSPADNIKKKIHTRPKEIKFAHQYELEH